MAGVLWVGELTEVVFHYCSWRGLRKGSLRTLGTVESLLLLTEWHPRSLHFPPNDATDELMLPLPAKGAMPGTYADDTSAFHPSTGFGGRRIDGWLEPAWRSDRHVVDAA